MPRKILISAFFVYFSLFTSIMCVPPMEHVIRGELLLTHAETGILFAIPFLMLVALAIPAGRTADLIGVRKSAGIGIVILAVGSILRGTSTDASSLFIFTFICGAGFGWIFPTLPKFVSTWISRERSGRTTGILVSGLAAGSAMAMALTMPLVFPVTGTFQGAFFIWGILPAVAAILWWVLVKDPLECEAGNWSVGNNHTPTFSLLRNKNLWLIAALLFLNEFFIMSWFGWSPSLLMLKGATPDIAGLISSMTVWVSIPAAFLMPRLAYRMGVKRPFLWIPSIVLALAAWGAIHMNLMISWLIMALVGFAEVTRFATVLALPVDIMSKRQVGIASGLVMSIGYAGGFIGPWITGRIMDITTNFDISLLVLVGVSIASVGIAFKIPETGAKASTYGRVDPRTETGK